MDAAAAPGTRSAVDSAWWIPLVMGIVSIIFGLMLLSNPAGTAEWVAWLVGLWWLVSGVVNLVMMFVDRAQWGWKLALGVLGVLAGMMVLQSMGQAPLWTTLGLATVYVWVLGIQGIVYGVIQLIQAFQGGGWGIGVLGGISIFFGLFLMVNPFPASLALPFVYGVIAIAGGIAAMVLAFKLKKELAA